MASDGAGDVGRTVVQGAVPSIVVRERLTPLSAAQTGASAVVNEGRDRTFGTSLQCARQLSF